MYNHLQRVLSFIFLLNIFINSSYISAQIGINTLNPNGQAIIDIVALNKGVLLPRLSSSQRNLINTPAIGLTIYNIDSQSIEWFNGSIWYNPIQIQMPPVISNITTTAVQATVAFSSVPNATSYKCITQPGNIITSGTSSPIIIPNLQSNTAYTFSVFANFPNFNTLPSASVNASTLLFTPEPPTQLTTLPGNNSIKLSWNPSSGTVDFYTVFYKTVSSSTWVNINTTTTELVIDNLINDENYVFKIKSNNNGGSSIDSRLLYSSPVDHEVLLSENFNNSLFDQTKWLEYEYINTNTPTTGSIRINEGRLMLNHGNDWTTNGAYLRSRINFNRLSENLVIQMDVTFPNCGISNHNAFLRYGQVNNPGTASAPMISLRKNTTTNYNLTAPNSISKSAAVNASCNSNNPVHFKMVLKKEGGLDVFVNGVLSPSLSLTSTENPNTFTDFPFSVNAIQTEPLFIDNIVVSGKPMAPETPLSIVALPGNQNASVSFTPPSNNGGSSILNYTVTSSPGNITATGTTSPIIINGLTNGVEYTFNVTATNAYGTSVNSLASNTVIPQGAINPPLVYAHNTKILLQWQSTYDAIDYLIEYKESSSSNWIVYNDGVSTKTSFSLTGLSNGVSYDIRLKPLTNNGGYDFSTPVSATPILAYNQNVWHQIVSSGQSLSLGANGAPALSLTQPYNNKMLNSTLTAFIPLNEPATIMGITNNESMSSALANTISQMTLPSQNFNSIVTLNGMGNTAYSGLKKGSNNYTNSINRVIAAKNIALSTTQTPYIVSAVTIVHGENDSYVTPNPIVNYKLFLEEWQNDYQVDIQNITGQTDIIPMFTCQVASNTAYGSSRATIALAQLQAAIDNPTKIYLVGPKYIYDYSDPVHMNSYSYRRHGEYYGKVMKKVLVDKQPWVPLSPSTITRNNNIITVNFHVPVAPLQFDTTAVMPVANYGFEYINAGSGITITNVALGANGTSVILTLSGTPSTPGQVGYAYTGINTTATGRFIAGSTKGNLCDSDPTPALNQDSSTPVNMGTTLKNWCVQFVRNVN